MRSTWRRELLLALALAAPAEAQTADRWREERERLVAEELAPQGITDSVTLAAMRAVLVARELVDLVLPMARVDEHERDLRRGTLARLDGPGVIEHAHRELAEALYAPVLDEPVLLAATPRDDLEA